MDFKRLIFLLSLMMIAAGLMLAGFSIASFSDNKKLDNNIFEAGTLDLETHPSNALPLILLDMKPYEHYANYFPVKNAGSLDFSWQISFEKKQDLPGATEEAKMSDLIQAEISLAKSLVYYLNQAKGAPDKEEAQGWLDKYIQALNAFKENNLIDSPTADELTRKALEIKNKLY